MPLSPTVLLDLTPTGVTINASATACLGAVVIRRVAGAEDSAGRKRLEREVLMGRLGSADEPAEFAAIVLDGRKVFRPANALRWRVSRTT